MANSKVVSKEIFHVRVGINIGDKANDAKFDRIYLPYEK